MKPKLSSPSNLLRSPIARGIAPGQSPVSRDGGKYGAGLIKGYSVITTGEAKGHDCWLDVHFLQQVCDAINYSQRGMKTRFTHPGLSGDGLGKFLGRSDNATLDGNSVRADQHFAKSAHNTPNGDLASYSMDLAEEDSEAFGASISFAHDVESEEAFASAFGGDNFVSPDPENVKSLPHVRLKQLVAIDLVDSPASNPTGMFHRGDNPAVEAEKIAEFCCGLTQACPPSESLGIDPQRTKSFIDRFLHRHNLSIVATGDGKEDGMPHKKSETKPEEKPEVESPKPAEATPAAETEPAETESQKEEIEEPAKASEVKPEGEVAARDKRDLSAGKRFIAEFGTQGAVWFAEGKSYEEAQKLFVTELRSSNEALKKELADMNGKLGRGEATPAAFSVTKSFEERKTSGFEGALGSAGLAKFAAGIVMPGQK